MRGASHFLCVRVEYWAMWRSRLGCEFAHRPGAPRSAPASNLATCLAIRRRTIGERASGTSNRSSRMPCARRRSRIALIRLDASAMWYLTVTRYSVTRYVTYISGPTQGASAFPDFG